MHSRNSIRATRTGFNQRQSFNFAAMRAAPQRPLLASGRLANAPYAPRWCGVPPRVTFCPSLADGRVVACATVRTHDGVGDAHAIVRPARAEEISSCRRRALVGCGQMSVEWL